MNRWTPIFHGETLFKLPFCWLVCGISAGPAGPAWQSASWGPWSAPGEKAQCGTLLDSNWNDHVFFGKIMMRFLETYSIHSRNLWNVHVVFGLNQSLPKLQDIPSTSSSHSNFQKHPSMFILLSGLPSYLKGAVRFTTIQDVAKGARPSVTGSSCACSSHCNRSISSISSAFSWSMSHWQKAAWHLWTLFPF